MLRLRSDKEFWGSLPFRRMVKRAMHLFAQAAEAGLKEAVVEECPLPHQASIHPFLRRSRLRGNKALEISLIHKFMVRGGGFVSAKNEVALSELRTGSRSRPKGGRGGGMPSTASSIHPPVPPQIPAPRKQGFGNLPDPQVYGARRRICFGQERSCPERVGHHESHRGFGATNILRVRCQDAHQAMQLHGRQTFESGSEGAQLLFRLCYHLS